MPSNPNHSRKARQQTKPVAAVEQAAEGVAKLSVGAPSRREREALEAAAAKERYRKLHEAGKTDEAKADLARLRLIREKRDADAARKLVCPLRPWLGPSTTVDADTRCRQRRRRRRPRTRPSALSLTPGKPSDARQLWGRPRRRPRRNKGCLFHRTLGFPPTPPPVFRECVLPPASSSLYFPHAWLFRNTRYSTIIDTSTPHAALTPCRACQECHPCPPSPSKARQSPHRWT